MCFGIGQNRCRLIALAMSVAALAPGAIWGQETRSAQKINLPEPPVSFVSPGYTYDPGERLSTPLGKGGVYYVDGAAGNDSNNGLALGTAFKTIGRALDREKSPLQAGDTLLIRAGVYRERIGFAGRSSTAEKRIVIGPYGDGEVIIDASAAVGGWVLHSGQIYRATPGFVPMAVVINNQPLYPENRLASLAAAPVSTAAASTGINNAVAADGRWYYDAAAGQLYVWAPGGRDPGTMDVGVVKNDLYQDGFFINNGASFITLYGVTVRFAGGHGVVVLGNSVRIEKVKSIFNGKSGISFFGHGNITSAGGEAIKNYAYHNVLSNWPRKNKWGGWPAGIASQGTPNPLFQGNISQKNGGEGILSYGGTAGGAVFRDNVALDNWSVNFYVDNQPNDVIDHNFAFCHDPDYRDTYNHGDDLSDGRLVRRLRAEGIVSADENYGHGANLANTTISNNLIVNCRRGYNHNAEVAGSGLKNLTFVNNTIVVPDAAGFRESFAGLRLPVNANNTGSVFRNNIVYATHPGTYVLDGISSAGLDNFQGLTLDHNLFHHAGRKDGWHWGADYKAASNHTHEQWLALAGAAHGGGDVLADPKLANPRGQRAADMRILDGSPAIGRGVSTGVTTDFGHAARPPGAGCDIGAYQFSGSRPRE